MKKVTIYDIANKLNVSPATITRAINGKPKVGDELRKLIISTAQDMGYRANKVAMSLARKEIKIAVLIYGAIYDFYSKLLEGIKDASMSLHDFNITSDEYVLSIQENNDEDFIRQLNSLNGYNGAVIYSIHDTPQIANAVDKLIEKKTIVYTINTDITTKNHHYCVMNNGEVTGRIAAELLDWMVTNRKICFFMGGKYTQVLSGITKSFTETAKKRGLIILDSYYDDGDEVKAYNSMNIILKKHCDVGGIYVNSAISSPICKRIMELGMHTKIKIVTSDLLPSVVDNIRNGIIQATIFQDPFLQGKTGFLNLYKIIAEGFNPSKNIYITPQIIIQNNLDCYLDNFNESNGSEMISFNNEV